MRFILLVNIKQGADMDQVKSLREAEVRQIWSLQKAGIIRAMHLRADEPGVVCEMECGSPADVKQHMGTLPMQRAGLNEYSMISLNPYSSYETLFR
jgi:hypothetical protein